MHLGDNKIVMSYISLDKLMLQLEFQLHGSLYFIFIIIVASPLVAASISIVCGRCAAHLMGIVRIIDRRANASSTKRRLS